MSFLAPIQNLLFNGINDIGKNLGMGIGKDLGSGKIPGLSGNPLDILGKLPGLSSGSLPGLSTNPLNVLGNLPNIGSVISNVLSSKSNLLPINPGMLGFLGPKGLVAGLAIKGVAGFVAGGLEGLSKGHQANKRRPMPEIDSDGPGRTGRRRPMPKIDFGGPSRAGRRRPMPKAPGECNGPECSSSENDDVSSRIDQIMNSNMPVAEKITMLAALMADVLDQQAEEVMKDWSEEMKRTSHQGDPKDKKATEGSDKAQNSQYLQVRLQQLMEKKNQLISLASNINKADHTTRSSVIRNIQV